MDGLVYKSDKASFMKGLSGIKYELSHEGFGEDEINNYLITIIKRMK